MREIVEQLGVYVIINMKYCLASHELLFDYVHSGENFGALSELKIHSYYLGIPFMIIYVCIYLTRSS